jgi:hypothetical protein
MDSRQYGKRFPGCLKAIARPSLSIGVGLFCYLGKEFAMSNSTQPSPRFPLFQRHLRSKFTRLWKPVAVTGAGGAALALWLEEILLFGAEILALIFLPIMAGLIYLLDILMFKSTTPKKEK